MTERFGEDDLTAILNIIDAAEHRLEGDVPLPHALDWAREEVINYQDGGPDIYAEPHA